VQCDKNCSSAFSEKEKLHSASPEDELYVFENFQGLFRSSIHFGCTYSARFFLVLRGLHKMQKSKEELSLRT